jgi:ubiquinone/menaquinone biosynthesis C-methylase UbiE
MPPATADTPYPLGGTSAEHARLIRQAATWDPLTERLFGDAGIGMGQRVLDIGSGVGDVAMLAARLVGPSGAVIGVERDLATIAMARSRVAKAALSNVSFIESDIRGVPSTELFGAVVGRAILQYLPEPGGALRSLAALVRPGGVVALQDVWPASLFHLTATFRCDQNAHRSFIGLWSAPACIWTWSWFSTARSWKRASPLRNSASRFPLATIRTLRDGSTISSVPWRRAWRRTNLPPAESATSKRSKRDSRPKGPRRDHLPQASRSSAPGRESLGDPTRLTRRRLADDRERRSRTWDGLSEPGHGSLQCDVGCLLLGWLGRFRAGSLRWLDLNDCVVI